MPETVTRRGAEISTTENQISRVLCSPASPAVCLVLSQTLLSDTHELKLHSYWLACPPPPSNIVSEEGVPRESHGGRVIDVTRVAVWSVASEGGFPIQSL